MQGKQLKDAKMGEVIYTHKADKWVTAQATYYKRKVKTERIIAMEGDMLQPIAVPLTKVIILDNPITEQNG